jgi:hypothetical protein
MSEFLCRVELHGAYREQYQQLHAAMHQSGFTSAVRADSGVYYHLPPAEYHFNGNANAAKEGVRDLAAQCARSVVPRFAVFVVPFNGWSAYGLEEVTKAA